MGLSVKNTIPGLKKASKKSLEEISYMVGAVATAHYTKGFSQGGGQTDNSLGGWLPRKKKDKQERKTGVQRAILVNTGALRRDIDVRERTLSKVVIWTKDTDYGSYHNEGTNIHPMREFIGKSRKLDSALSRKMKAIMDKNFDK